MSAYIAYTKPKGIIKVVSICSDTEIDELGTQLLEYFKDYVDVKELVTNSIDYIDEGEVEFISELDNEFEFDGEYEEYETEEDLLDSISNSYCYLFKNNTWYVAKPNQDTFNDLETILEEEY